MLALPTLLLFDFLTCHKNVLAGSPDLVLSMTLHVPDKVLLCDHGILPSLDIDLQSAERVDDFHGAHDFIAVDWLA